VTNVTATTVTNPVTATLSTGTTVVAEEFYFGHGCLWVKHDQGWSPIASHDWTWLERMETVTITRHLSNVHVVPHAYKVGATYIVRSPDGIHDIWSKNWYKTELTFEMRIFNVFTYSSSFVLIFVGIKPKFVVSDILQTCFARDGLKVSAYFF